METNKDVNRIEVYKELTKYYRPEDVPKEGILKKYGISDRQYGGMLTAIRKSPLIYKEMLKANYAPEQIPPLFDGEKTEANRNID